MRFEITSDEALRPDERRIEIVERKGLGHPDSICDALAEAFSLELSRFYLEQTGRILHHNVDKVLLAAGSSRPRFGGGEIVEPIQILLAGRATRDCDGASAPFEALATRASRRWLAGHLRALDAERHIRVTSLVRPGSSELVSLYDERGRASRALANDTSCGVGFAPLSELERVVLAVEQRLNSAAAHAAAPALGEDVKVMAIRDGDAIELTIACAMIDRSLDDVAAYARAVQSAAELALKAAGEITSLPVRVGVNAADDLAAQRIYLTVSGTSAEAGDDGQAGRGNRANGLITPGRPMTIESVAGKNPVTHVGKLYSIAANLIAERLAVSFGEVRGAECRLVSRIGQPIEEPWLVEVRLAGADPLRDAMWRREVERIVRDELDQLSTLAEQLVRGDLRLDRWPMRA
jgi:S-adenosylmethionine synthetase